jgi:hypothetical protein
MLSVVPFIAITAETLMVLPTVTPDIVP